MFEVIRSHSGIGKRIKCLLLCSGRHRKQIFSNFSDMKFGNIVPDIGVDIVPDICNDIVSYLGYDVVSGIVYDIRYYVVSCELEKGSM